jgi:hypothetical protein
MAFDLHETREILSRTPATLRTMLADLPDAWLKNDEGPDTWNPFDVLGHLIHGEETDWMPRLRLILERGETQRFEPFDRFAQMELSQGKSAELLLDTFADLRAANLKLLADLDLQPEDLDRRGRHPDFGPVTLRQLLATWVVHDLGHVAQIARAMARRYADEVGPWRAYLPVLTR